MIENNVASIIVTYNPEEDVIENVRSISQSCKRLVIIDNGSSNHTKAFLKQLEQDENTVIFYNQNNMGLGYALNQGIKYILHSSEMNQVEWIATFDQDSKITGDYFSKILASYKAHEHKEEVAILAPNWVEKKLNQEVSPIHESKQLQERITVITSGSLMKKEIFNRISLFKEDFFIDFLDHEFCLRARSHGYKIYMSPQVSMVHNLGNTNQHKFLGSTVMATNHNYIRRYYMTRNRIYTYKKYFRTEKEWIKEDFIATAKEFIIILLFEKDRPKKLASMFKGLFDAFLGKKGARKL
ncbi:glycosyltransferase family 2 protein [Neobacillus sp. Marseille-QA0830]